MNGVLSVGAYSLAAAPMLPWWAIAALGAAALVVLALAALRQARGWPWRAASIAMLLAALVNPSMIKEQRSPLHDVAVVVVDRSPSQAIGHRTQATEAALAAIRRRLAPDHDLDLRVVDAGKQSPGGEDDGTRLFAALNRAMADVPRRRLAGIVMITDGEVDDVPKGSPKTLEAQIGAPLHVLLSGQPNERDRRLVVAHAPAFGLVGKAAIVTVRVEDLPRKTENRETEAQLTWRKDGGPPHPLMVPIGSDVSLAIPIDHGGPNVVELAVAPGPHSLTPINKRAAVVINGVRDRLHVLLVSGMPHIGERVWRNILKSDPSVDLVHFTILRPPEKQDGTPIRELSLIAFPIHELFDVKLKQFDLIIFDRYNQQGIIPQSYIENVVRYVRNGGAFLEAAGPSSGSATSLFRTPLGQILPAEPTGQVEEEGFKPELTASGRRDPVTDDLPGAGKPGEAPSWGRWFRQIDAHVRHGVTVMKGADGEPLLVLDRVGKGRVAQLLSDQMWLWWRGFEGGGPQAELLRRLAYWLMKEPALEENDLQATIDGDRLTVIRQSLEPDNKPVVVTAPDGSKKSLALTPEHGGLSKGSMPIAQMGLYHVTDGTRTALAAAGPLNPLEYADVRTTPKKLAPVAEATGGGIFWVGDGHMPEIRRVSAGDSLSGRDWMGFRRNGDYVVIGFTETSLLPGIAALLLAIGTLIAAWRREGR